MTAVSVPLLLPLLGTVLLLQRLVPQKMRNGLLLAAGYFFCWILDPRLPGLILLSTVADYLAALGIHRSRSRSRKRAFLGISLAVNLGVLFLCKYLGFFLAGVAGALALAGLRLPLPVLRLLLPVALSFYTFKTLTYTIDVYRERLLPTRNFFDYALFVSFFPQLLAGPIERAAHFLPQARAPRPVSRDHWIEGTWLFLRGLFKKAVVADNLALVVQGVFDSGGAASGAQVLLATYAFTFQIYGDFSGYTDMARGVAKLLGFDTPQNFDRPYGASNPVEFWQRWHITLSTWLRDYLFLPIAYAVMRRADKGSWKGKAEDWGYVIGMAATMLLAGLWHGAAWTFVAWGGYHGVLLAGHHLLARRRKRKRPKSGPTLWLKRLAFFHLLALGWLVFRSQSLGRAWGHLHALLADFSPSVRDFETAFLPLFYCALWWLLERLGCSRDDPRSIPGWEHGWGPALVTCLVLLLVVFGSTSGQEFIYARF